MIPIDDFVKQLGSQLSAYKAGIIESVEVELSCVYKNNRVFVIEVGDDVKNTFKIKLQGFFV